MLALLDSHLPSMPTSGSFSDMFMSGPNRRPDKAVAMNQLRQHLTMMVVWLAAVRLTPFVLHLIFKDAEKLELQLEL